MLSNSEHCVSLIERINTSPASTQCYTDVVDHLDHFIFVCINASEPKAHLYKKMMAPSLSNFLARTIT